MNTLLNRLRHHAGLCLLRSAMRLLNHRSSEWMGSARGLREQRLYDRYVGYCGFTRGALYDRQGRKLSAGVAPLPIHRWREQKAWLDRKFANRRCEDFDGSALLLS